MAWTSADDAAWAWSEKQENLERKRKGLKPKRIMPFPYLSWEKVNPVTWYYMYGKIKMIEITLTTYGYKVWYSGVIKGMDGKRPLSHIDLLRHQIHGTKREPPYYKTLAEAKENASNLVKYKLFANTQFYKEKK